MIAQPTEKPDIPRTETGWAQAHHRRDRPDLGVRTCVPAVPDRTGTWRPGNGPEDTIVRGED
ncbi:MULTISPECIES: hypothetical protein [Streptomyces]|uniref:hypothetical protein n=1 Tax=Streptomyces TaxID=1883 RepID=UPI00138AC072|nr:hypothetical protein [Streptomyces murinus]NDK26795.1 hypothetical protein [Streptomyces sp. TR1341]